MSKFKPSVWQQNETMALHNALRVVPSRGDTKVLRVYNYVMSKVLFEGSELEVNKFLFAYSKEHRGY